MNDRIDTLSEFKRRYDAWLFGDPDVPGLMSGVISPISDVPPALLSYALKALCYGKPVEEVATLLDMSHARLSSWQAQDDARLAEEAADAPAPELPPTGPVEVELSDGTLIRVANVVDAVAVLKGLVSDA